MLKQITAVLGDAVQSNTTTVFLHGTDFEAGYHNGFQAYIERFAGKPFTDKDISNFFSSVACDVFHSGIYNAGYSLGWGAAMHKDGSLKPIQVQGLVGEA